MPLSSQRSSDWAFCLSQTAPTATIAIIRAITSPHSHSCAARANSASAWRRYANSSPSDHDDKPCNDVDRLVEQQLADIERKIADLSLLRDELSQMALSCKGERIGDCRIVDSLGRR